METDLTSSRKNLEWADHFRHYLKLLVRKKWRILLTGLLVWGVTAGFFLKSDSFQTVRPATVLIGMDRPLQATGNNEADDMGFKKIELIRSRNFLKQVALDLSLGIRTEKVSREQVFDSLSLGPDAVAGKYEISVRPDQKPRIEIRFSKAVLGFEGKSVYTSDTRDVRMPGLFLRLDSAFVRSRGKAVFRVVPQRQAVDGILDNMTIERPTGRKENYFTITITGKDYPLVTKTANAIADRFVSQNLGFGKRRLHEKLAMLEGQLEPVRKQLAESDNALRSFLAENPAFALDRQTEQTVGNLVQEEAESMELDNLLSDAIALQNQLKRPDAVDRDGLTHETIILLASRNSVRAAMLQSELSRLVSERELLERSYSKEHPVLLANRRKLDEVAVQSAQTLDDYILSLKRNVQQKKNGVYQLSGRLRSLPQKSLRLAELRRQQQIDSETYSQLMGRYNQGKIEDAIDISDVFVMDYAVEPIPLSRLMKWLMAVAAGFALGVLCGFGPVIILDRFRRTANSETELLCLTSLPVLESIPELRAAASVASLKPEDRLSSPFLVTHGVLPEYAREIYRSLRTKLLLNMWGEGRKSLIITSLDAGVGKSLTAANMAVTLAQHGLRILVVDGDLRRGTLHLLFGLKRTPGLSGYLAGVPDGKLTDWFQVTQVPGLSLMSSGKLVDDTSELMTPANIGRFLDAAFKSVDMILMDTPPIGVTADAAVVHEKFARYVVVLKSGSTNVVDLNDKIAEYPPLREKVIGLVLNRVRHDERFKYYRNSPYIRKTGA